jgi:phospholipase C
MDGPMSQIDHVVVLMLENRSFDSILGKLYPNSAGFNGLSGAESNLDATGQRIAVWNSPGVDDTTMVIPSPDPGELYIDINTQLFGTPGVPVPPSPTMGGFVGNYMTQPDPGSRIAKSVMHYFSPEQVPAISKLARQFAVCDQWHASAPCQTWPNRFFVHTGTAGGYENNSPTHFPYEMPTIFTRFQKQGVPGDWRIYFHDVPQSLALSDLWPHVDHFRLYAEFVRDARNDTLPSYSFIEPRYFPDSDLPNDQHPPHVVTLGEQLIADVYNQLRSGPSWTRTLLIITYDEHGGCFDHVAPPPAVPPNSISTAPFNFDRYGVRVPALLISPWIPQGTVLRPLSPGAPPFDHTSIITLLRNRFSLGPQLTDRDGVAPDPSSALTLTAPTNLGPERVDALPYAASPTDVARARSEPPNKMQEALTELAAHLPQNLANKSLLATLDNRLLTALNALPADLANALQSRSNALHFIKDRLSGFLSSL